MEEYKNTPNLIKMCRTVTDEAISYRWDFQEKINFVDVTPGSSIARERPQIRQVTATPKPRASRLASDIFTQAQIKPQELTNFSNLQMEAVHRDHNQLIFDEVNSTLAAGNILPDGHVIGTTSAPITFNVDHLLNVGRIFANEGVNKATYIITANEYNSLMQDERFVSRFFNDRTPLPFGYLSESPAAGVQLYVVPQYPSQSQFVKTGLLPSSDESTNGSNQVFAMATDAFGAFFNKTPHFKTWYDDETFTWLVDTCYQADVSLLRPNGLIITNSENVVSGT